MKMKSVTLFFLFFLLFEALCCGGCLKEERQALLALNSRVGTAFYSFWELHTDCCEWEGVQCNSSTGRVAQLQLWDSIQQQYINYSDFSGFKDLKNLYLLDGNIVGCVGGEGLPNLELLYISHNRLNTAASIVSCLDGLPSLKSLQLVDNGFNASSFHVFEPLSSMLPNLEVLDISENILTNHILSSLEGFTSLKELYLQETGLDSDVHIKALCSKLRNLELLDLSGNNLNHTDIGSALSGLSSLKSLYLVNSGLTWRSILSVFSTSEIFIVCFLLENISNYL
ncbi:cuscuta receptor 1-like [Phaseolus vulgaris]|uniref:cuscuta receptor 1-like n=1 Tax=Phaseolus vulgaris TaxID=3885 RepID=UPI0035CC8AFB